MKYYFYLQYVRLCRWLESVGIQPQIGMLLIAIFFIIGSQLFFDKYSWSSWVYVLLALIFTFRNLKGESMLQMIKVLDEKSYKKLKWINQFILLLPFLMMLCWNAYYMQAGLLLLLVVLTTLFDLQQSFVPHFVTPFRKIPFENIVGFRQNIVLIAILYFVLMRSLQVGNFNLALGIQAGIFLVHAMFYIKPEHPYFVWSYNMDGHNFIMHKIKYAILGASIEVAPVILLNMVFFSKMILWIVLVYFIGILFLLTVVLAKYSSYPNEMNLPQAILISLCIGFPPLILICIPLFYKQSQKRLMPYFT